jgi:hypothetical protein
MPVWIGARVMISFGGVEVVVVGGGFEVVLVRGLVIAEGGGDVIGGILKFSPM